MRYNAISGCTHLSKFADKSKIKIDRREYLYGIVK